MITIEMLEHPPTCRKCFHTMPAITCEAPLCPRLRELQTWPASEEVARIAANLRAELEDARCTLWRT